MRIAVEHRVFGIAALLLSLAAAASAETIAPMRELIVQSETIVLAVPAGPSNSARFKVIRVLLGTALKEGDIFEVEYLSSYNLIAPGTEGEAGRKPVKTAEALLFFGPKRTGFDPLPAGLRIATADGGLYYPEPRPTPPAGRYALHPYHSDVRWTDLVRRAEADAAEVSHIRSLKAIKDLYRRNAALLDWVERRRAEFGGGLTMDDGEEPSFGWGSLERDVFQWILESRIPEDCWAAVQLYAELNRGAVPGMGTAAFGSRAGRAWLLAVAADAGALAGRRERSLELLGAGDTLWPLPSEARPGVEPLNEQEQAALIDQLAQMLKDPNRALRGNAAAAILQASAPTNRNDLESFHTQRALAALTAAYKAEPPGWVRNGLARAVGVIGGPKLWADLTGNAHGVVALLEDPDCRNGAVMFCVFWAPQVLEPIGEGPTLMLERLDEKGKVVEKKEEPLEVKYDLPHYGAVSDYFNFSLANFTPGLWRMTVKGTVGADKASWVSEPRLLHLAPPTPTGQPNYNPSAPRIIFDP